MNTNIGRFYTMDDTDTLQVSLDLTRNTAVIIRGLGKRQETVRASQEQLVSLARKLRGDETNEHIHVCTHANPSQQTASLLEDITNGRIGSIIDKRPGRLFRSEQERSMQILQKHHIIIIVLGKRVYDFSKEGNLKAFQIEMQDAHNYIATHITYMHTARRQKRQRDQEIN